MRRELTQTDRAAPRHKRTRPLHARLCARKARRAHLYRLSAEWRRHRCLVALGRVPDCGAGELAPSEKWDSSDRIYPWRSSRADSPPQVAFFRPSSRSAQPQIHVPKWRGVQRRLICCRLHRPPVGCGASRHDMTASHTESARLRRLFRGCALSLPITAATPPRAGWRAFRRRRCRDQLPRLPTLRSPPDLLLTPGPFHYCCCSVPV